MSKHVRDILRRGQRGFTLIELVAVMAILGVLAGLVAGAVSGMGERGQLARLAADKDTIGKASDRFYTDAFPPVYPVEHNAALVALARDGISIPSAVAPRLVAWAAKLPQDPTKGFVPDYLKDIPDSAALVSWRMDMRTSSVFFADDGALLIPPSTANVDVKATSTALNGVSKYRLDIKLNQYEAAQEVVSITIPEGYTLGLPTSGLIGTVSGKFLKDNPWTPGTVINFTGRVEATPDVNTWELTIDFPMGAGSGTFPVTYSITVVRPTTETPGKITLDLAAATTTSAYQAYLTAPSWHSSSQELVLTLGTDLVSLITNPTVAKVYRWLAEEFTTIDVAGVFNPIAGMQAVVIK